MQEDIINSVLNKTDTLALLPTGGGKSLCFQVPAMAMDGVCIVISPLIALMKDQVETLERKGINAQAISSAMPYREVREVLKNAAAGEYKFLYIAPERIETQAFIDFLYGVNAALIAVDEAHCISQWGYDFRPAYLRIKKIRERLQGVPVIALTASATPEVQEDICTQLQFENGKIFRQSFERPNLAYSVEKPTAKQKRIPELLNEHPGSAIVYCRTRRQTQWIAELLTMQGFSADYYHAGLKHELRARKQEAWLNSATRIMVSTNAFGMGIDKPDVRMVIHAESPDCLENYYQEAGRAGRDGKPSWAILLTGEAEFENMKRQAEVRFPTYVQLKQIYTALMDHLQVPAGFGEGKSFDIDVSAFAAGFGFEMLQAYYGILALSKCGVLYFNESFSSPSTVEFLCNKEDLVDFEKLHPELSSTVQGLLRSYEGIFDSLTTIHESALASFIGVPYGVLVTNLGSLHRAGVIHYQMQSEKPRVTLLLNRMYQDAFRIDTALLTRLKNVYHKRLNKIYEYVEDDQSCRSEFLAAYFGSITSGECNICDNCLAKKPVSETDISRLAQKILFQLSPTKATPYSVVEMLGDRGAIKNAVVMLQEEQLICADEHGNLLRVK